MKSRNTVNMLLKIAGCKSLILLLYVPTLVTHGKYILTPFLSSYKFNFAFIVCVSAAVNLSLHFMCTLDYTCSSSKCEQLFESPPHNYDINFPL